MMRVHHLNCATMCPWSRRLVNGEGGWLEPGRMVCHSLLIETDAGLVLVDGGLGLLDVQEPVRRLGRAFLGFARAALDPAETAIRQIAGLGHAAADLHHIVPTHLDLDHAGALSDFPEARVHIFEPELRAATSRSSYRERNRYRTAQWEHGPRWQSYRTEGESWFGFECVRPLAGLPPEILLVPLLGHTRGHCGVAVQTPDGWLLHAGDAYFFHGEMDPAGRRCTPGLELFQRLVQMDGEARMHNQQRLRELARQHSGEIRVFCAHDPVEYETLAGSNRKLASGV
jgi:glyoxylase-like metal-dependent hydrolase (beta-lactamase superfamily II)